MRTYIKTFINISLTFVFIFSGASQAKHDQSSTVATTADDTLIVGVFPRRNASTTIKLFTPMAKYLSKKLGHKVNLETAKDFRSFWQKVLLQRYDIVHFNQYHYIKTHDKNKYRAILQNEEFGKKAISGAIVVRKDSGINSLKDLKNKKIIFAGGKKAMISYVVNTALLNRAGLTKDDYIEQFSKNPPNSVMSIFYKQGDAAGAGDPILKLPLLKKSIDTTKMRILAQSKPLAHLPWAVKTSMPDSLSKKIQTILLELNDSKEGKKILKRAKLSGIHRADDSTYNPHRKILKEVFGDNY